MQRSPKAERSVSLSGGARFVSVLTVRALSAPVATSEFRVASGSGNYAHEETDQARTVRTKLGPLGCGGRRRRTPHRRCMNDNDVLLLLTKIQWSRQCAPGRSPAAERSVLCPHCPCLVRFFMGVEASHIVLDRWRGLVADRCSRRARLGH